MTDYSSYLLRTQPQIRAFRARYGGYISGQAGAYVSWILRMPLREWMDYLMGVPQANIPVVIGTICILYIDRRIDIDFNATATRIRRNWSEEEFAAFWKHRRDTRTKK